MQHGVAQIMMRRWQNVICKNAPFLRYSALLVISRLPLCVRNVCFTTRNSVRIQFYLSRGNKNIIVYIRLYTMTLYCLSTEKINYDPSPYVWKKKVRKYPICTLSSLLCLRDCQQWRLYPDWLNTHGVRRLVLRPGAFLSAKRFRAMMCSVYGFYDLYLAIAMATNFLWPSDAAFTNAVLSAQTVSP